MKFTVTKASSFGWDKEEDTTMDIESIDDLKVLSFNHNNRDLVINFTDKTIIIYDDYLE